MKRAPENEQPTVAAFAQRMGHAPQDPERICPLGIGDASQQSDLDGPGRFGRLRKATE